jgi:hypothetical protein
MEDKCPIPGQWVFRVILAVLGVITGVMFAFSGFLLEFLVGGAQLKYYDPSLNVAFDRQVILGESSGTVFVLLLIPILPLLLIGLPGRVLRRVRWAVGGVYFTQVVAARTFGFVTRYFFHDIDDPRVVATFAEIRQEMTTLDRWIYSPLVNLLEHGWGYWAIALHSIVLGAFWTLVVYGVYLLVRAAVERRRKPEDAPHEDPA